MTSCRYVLRKGVPEDVPVLFAMIKELAVAQGFDEGAVRVTESELLKDGFSDSKMFNLLMVECHQESGITPAGYAIYFYTYSTFEGKSVYLEDVYIRSEHRRQELGTAIFVTLSKIAETQNCCRIAFSVLDDNVNAKQFYNRLGVITQREWIAQKLDKHGIAVLASKTVKQNISVIV
ncbi:diamine acetyltransferase 1-like isoform X2 [Oscarella lobularis]|uniref:diamine acetyltransferase 1-like isoform X2 n=1 Tax=Oscarella lobularis TaxID=121494 RepID=UPI003313C941